MADAHVRLDRVARRFGATVALDDVSVEIGRGTIHAIVGENGAGKSTLGKVVSGRVRPQAGTIHVDGRAVAFRTPRDALRAGIATISQEVALAPRLSVLDNVLLGVESARAGVLLGKRAGARFRRLAEVNGLSVDPSSLAGSLRVAEQLKVELLRAFARDAALIVMDEPTAGMDAHDVRSLLATMRTLRDRGTTVVYVSHFLSEVLEVADTITILRNGRLVRTAPAREETHDSLVAGMIGGAGRDAGERGTSARHRADAVALEVRGLTGRGFQDVDLRVHEGEVVGLAGLVGAGRTELARALYGAERPLRGSVHVCGQPVSRGRPCSAIQAGLVMIPEDRRASGLIGGLCVADNVALPSLSRISRRGVVARRGTRAEAGRLLDGFDVRPANLDVPAASLSGGNQQKMIFAKWAGCRPRVLIVDEPTRGIDVAAKQQIHARIAELAEGGTGILLISSDQEELLQLADRIAVMHKGRLVAHFDPPPGDEDVLVRAMFGGSTVTRAA
ncbi:Fructose import ATP-binding protein FruK [Baekduia alba]|uniref:sugar ABC transporter ATP-binding protein n=1 Tax=Baekduia alba TaxID=2997333 RepID=UPI00234168F2|nr:sugar ABC transporter ATP-binding protein [Baekduia alba]WCB92261.1 Fructose import ATP-binding protein FruK [Baekduia alba]